MRRLLKALGLLCLCLVVSTPLYAAIFTTPIDDPFAHRFEVEGRYIDFGKTNFSNDAFCDEKIALRQWMVQSSATHCVCPSTGVFVSGTYYDTHFHWINSPFFQQSRFPELQFMVGGFTGLAHRWLWRGAFGVSVQTENISFGRYGTYRGLLWGRYAAGRRWGAHVGVLFCRGLKSTYVLPILGVDWCIKPTLRLNLVFPLDVSLRWCPHRIFSAAVAGRWLRCRLRAGEDNPLSQGLFEFRTWGIEGRLMLTPTCRMGLDLFAGSTVWGWTRVENPTGTTLQFRNTTGAPYAGVEGYLRF